MPPIMPSTTRNGILHRPFERAGLSPAAGPRECGDLGELAGASSPICRGLPSSKRGARLAIGHTITLTNYGVWKRVVTKTIHSDGRTHIDHSPSRRQLSDWSRVVGARIHPSIFRILSGKH